MQGYVVGFCFHESGDEVVLIRKQHPSWQKGKLNGVGGKMEPGESGYQTMVREFQEETGIRLAEWEQFATIRGTSGPTKRGADHPEDWVIYFFKAFDTVAFDTVDTLTDEPIERISVGDLPGLTTVPHLKWLVPLALYGDQTYEIMEK
jgi:8-oxo-dGTP diphosphatase